MINKNHSSGDWLHHPSSQNAYITVRLHNTCRNELNIIRPTLTRCLRSSPIISSASSINKQCWEWMRDLNTLNTSKNVSLKFHQWGQRSTSAAGALHSAEPGLTASCSHKQYIKEGIQPGEWTTPNYHSWVSIPISLFQPAWEFKCLSSVHCRNLYVKSMMANR